MERYSIISPFLDVVLKNCSLVLQDLTQKYCDSYYNHSGVLPKNSFYGTTLSIRVESVCTVWQYSARQTKLIKYSVNQQKFGSY